MITLLNLPSFFFYRNPLISLSLLIPLLQCLSLYHFFRKPLFLSSQLNLSYFTFYSLLKCRFVYPTHVNEKTRSQLEKSLSFLSQKSPPLPLQQVISALLLTLMCCHPSSPSGTCYNLTIFERDNLTHPIILWTESTS